MKIKPRKPLKFVRNFLLLFTPSNYSFFVRSVREQLYGIETNRHHIYFSPVCYGHRRPDFASRGLHYTTGSPKCLLSRRSAQPDLYDHGRLSLNASPKIRFPFPGISLSREQLKRSINRSESWDRSWRVNRQHPDPLGARVPYRPPTKALQKRPTCVAGCLKPGRREPRPST